MSTAHCVSSLCIILCMCCFFFFSSRRRHTRLQGDWSSDVCSSDLYYNFRGSPDVLEEGQELWGVYVFKRGFGGYPLRFLETHDMVYQPVIYAVYRRLLDIKRWRDERQHTKLAKQMQEHKEEQAVSVK